MHGNQPLTNREKNMILMKSIMDYGMGTLWFSMGIFIIFVKNIKPDLQSQFDDPMMKIFGGICIIYGSFRIYRGYKKNYLRER
jgi:hypothetical protein